MSFCVSSWVGVPGVQCLYFEVHGRELHFHLCRYPTQPSLFFHLLFLLLLLHNMRMTRHCFLKSIVALLEGWVRDVVDGFLIELQELFHHNSSVTIRIHGFVECFVLLLRPQPVMQRCPDRLELL